MTSTLTSRDPLVLIRYRQTQLATQRLLPTPGSLPALMEIADVGGSICSNALFARLQGGNSVTKSNWPAAINTLVELGLIVRECQDGAHPRTHLRITDEGRQMVADNTYSA